ncbi:MAG: AI-2E family transporter [Flavipsychrobacter sp.]|nr:AI-2E family transporter [Flavipsychrobacter sp.]
MRNDTVKQYLLIGTILVLTYTLGAQLFVFFPGLLGAITLYILMREYYFKLTVIKHWRKGFTAALFILASIIVIVLPIAGMIQVILPKFTALIENQDAVTATLQGLADKMKNISPQFQINQQQVMEVIQKITAAIPDVLGATANMLTNTVLAFFLLYFMLVDGRKMEMSINKYLPLKDTNVDNIWEATRTMVVSNAIGIPVLAACQAVVAMIGYAIFGIESWALWGIFTGVASLVPVVGCMLIWGPLSIYLFATAHPGAAIGLALYSFIITGGIDNVLRFTILKKLGDVHPIITTLGIIVGLPLFGFMGLIFGPLLVSYLLLMIKIYRAEFPDRKE